VVSDIKLVRRIVHHLFPLVKINTDNQRLAVLMLAREEFAFFLCKPACRTKLILLRRATSERSREPC
jgi:hypothetical protein